MATIDITAENFGETIETNDIVLVDFWADWCGPCKQFAPIYATVSEANPEITYAQVDTEEEQARAAQAQITSITTLMAYREGILVFNQAGALPEQALNQLVDAVKGLDMEEVRAKVAEHEAGHSQN